MDNEKNIPLSVILENTKGKITVAINQIVNESKLPAFLVEGILLGILSDVREQKNFELICDYNSMDQGQEKEKEGEK